MEMPSVHIGNMVRAELERQGKSVAWLAEQLNMQRPNCYRLLRSQSIHTDQLRQLSVLLKHDFFADCAALERNSNEQVAASTSVEFMQEFERKVLHTRMELIKELEDGDRHYRFFYQAGFIDCFASIKDNYIEFSLPYVAELPYTPELFAAAMKICNRCNKQYILAKFQCNHDEEKEKIYFEVSYQSIILTTLDQAIYLLEGTFVMGEIIREEVEELRQLVQQYTKFPFALHMYQNS